ncbi:MAG: DUF4157 domain-containing protein [Chitinophagaceae bacterium]|nr:DUF4157 domain-containing protein [Chitinophagaceae bacterium]
MHTTESTKINRNRGVSSRTSSFFPPLIQPKLHINQPNDVYEQEADAIAERVMRMPDPATKPLFFQPKPAALTLIQKKCSYCKEEEEKIQMKGESHSNGVVTASSQVHDVIKSSGQSMDTTTRNFMESRFGYDFGNVRIHNDSSAHQSSTAVNALAYTYENHIVFGAGHYKPESHMGKRLIAHELAHVIQQSKNANGGKTQRTPVSTEDDLHAPLLSQYNEVNPFDEESNVHTVEYAQWLHDKTNGLSHIIINMQAPVSDPKPDYSKNMSDLNAMETADFITNIHGSFSVDTITVKGNQKSFIREINFEFRNPKFIYYMASEIDKGIQPGNRSRIAWRQIQLRILRHAEEHFRRYRAVTDEIKRIVDIEFRNLPRYSWPSGLPKSDMETYTQELILHLISKLKYRLWETTCDWERVSYPTLFKGITSISVQGLRANCPPQPALTPYPLKPILVTPSTKP